MKTTKQMTLDFAQGAGAAGKGAYAMKALLSCTPLLLGLAGFAPLAQAAECGTVTIASMNWASAELLAEVDKFILQNGYGCDASIVLGDTVPTLTSMAEKGKPDVAPESWTSLRPPITQKNIQEGKLLIAGKAFTEGGVQGIYIPRFIVDAHPDIKTIADALKHPELFPDPEDPSKGAWSAGQQGWGGTVIASQYYKAYKARDAGFNLVDTGSAAGHDGSLIHAYERKKGWIGYYWEPTSLLGKYEMVRLSSGAPYDEAEWNRCNKVEKCPDPKPNEWPADEVNTIVTRTFAEHAGPAYKYLSTRSWPNALVNRMLAWMADNQATGEDGAKAFLKRNPDVWVKWVDADAAEKIKSAL
ncbi:ABC transporter substrate-binding protein [Pseudomonas citronellolis]|uniref:ABC transporter substrate-binding protein n=1 Tax=Pseudomonas citronellolis TaxID=53408 RepID=UPI002D79BCEA|nr:ABC transporter substrate-binding protein [Pseudomonas citronellolis]WRT82195.1 ABC transporter substrate-binding protein [Pseudomonas citronellolis]